MHVQAWFRWIRLLLDCNTPDCKVISRDVARDILRKLWLTPANLVEPRLGKHGYECFRALFYELNGGGPRAPFRFETRCGEHLGFRLSGAGLQGRRVSWFDFDRQCRRIGRVDRWRLKPGQLAGGNCTLFVKEDETDAVLEIDGPSLQHDIHVVEDRLSDATNVHVPPELCPAYVASRNRPAAAGAGPVVDDIVPDVAALVGLNELSRMAVEVFDPEVAEAARQQLLELVDIWEEVPGALNKIMTENGGLAVQRLRDATAQQRLSSLQRDLVERSIRGVLSESRGIPSRCGKCGLGLVSTGERAPVRI